jgi:hypothetical protein
VVEEVCSARAHRRMIHQPARPQVASTKIAANVKTPLRFCHLDGALGTNFSGCRSSMTEQLPRILGSFLPEILQRSVPQILLATQVLHTTDDPGLTYSALLSTLMTTIAKLLVAHEVGIEYTFGGSPSCRCASCRCALAFTVESAHAPASQYRASSSQTGQASGRRYCPLTTLCRWAASVKKPALS